MPFGFFNIPASFQGYINEILAKRLNIFFIVYIDDILIYIEDPGQAHINAFWWALKELWKNDLFANFKKSWFYKDKICFLRYVISEQEIRMKNLRIKAMINLPEPKSVCGI